MQLEVPIIGPNIFCLFVVGGGFAQLPHLYVTTLNVVFCNNISYEYVLQVILTHFKFFQMPIIGTKFGIMCILIIVQ